MEFKPNHQRNQPQEKAIFHPNSIHYLLLRSKFNHFMHNNNVNSNINTVNRLIDPLHLLSKKDEEYLKSFSSGWRFCPDEHELIREYLAKKIPNQPMHANKIRSLNLYLYNPETSINRLSENQSGQPETEWYFFTPRDRKYKNGGRPNGRADGGYCKATGRDKSIKHEDIVIGYKKSLVFYEGNPPKDEKTNWIMHEYRVHGPRRNKRNADDMRLDDWVLCKIYKKADKNVAQRAQETQHAEDSRADNISQRAQETQHGEGSTLLDGENEASEVHVNNSSPEIIQDQEHEDDVDYSLIFSDPPLETEFLDPEFL